MKQIIRIIFEKIFKSDQFSYNYSETKKTWFLNGKRHRENGPAVIYINGRKEYWFNGKLHREKGPAIVGQFHEEYWVNGKQHRVGGPAVKWNSGLEEWWINGQLHRADGPAIAEYLDGKLLYAHWWYNGKEIKCSSQKEFEKLIKLQAFW